MILAADLGEAGPEYDLALISVKLAMNMIPAADLGEAGP